MLLRQDQLSLSTPTVFDDVTLMPVAVVLEAEIPRGEALLWSDRIQFSAGLAQKLTEIADSPEERAANSALIEAAIRAALAQ